MTAATTASPDPRSRRLQHLVALLREQPLPTEAMLRPLNQRLKAERLPEISLRTLQHDLEWMQAKLGSAGIERVARAELEPPPPPEFHHCRMFYRLCSAEDLIPIAESPVFLTELEALALVAARGLLATPPAPGITTGGDGPLAEALGTLIRRLGLDAKDARIPDVIAVTQAAPQPYDPAHVLTILSAIRLGDGVRMNYAPLNKPTHPVIAQPVRLALVDAEPYLWAWDGTAKKLKNYKVARIAVVSCCTALPDAPSGLDSEVRSHLSGSFRGVAGADQRGRVVVRVTATGVPHVRHRRLGGVQKWEELPDGGARVSFNTSGMDAVKHWLLQYGSQAVVESPPRLVDWFRGETEQMAALYR
jgi:predicted DNA-binding transcriptional regulator YafY